MARSSGDTLSLKNLGTAVRTTATGSGVSLNAINDSAGTEVSLDDFGIDTVGGVAGFTYVVENTTETYRLGFTVSGSLFQSKIANQADNFTWSVPAGSKLSVNTNSGETATFDASTMTDNTDNTDQTVLQTVASHTVRVVFDDTFNDHATNHGSNRDKTVYTVDSYDNNASALCLTADSPIIMYDGTVSQVGDLEEGDELLGYNPTNLNLDSDADFFEWNSSDISGEYCKVNVKDIIFSFASSYYNINNGEIRATSEHPMLVWDSEEQLYKFKEMFRLKVGDRLIKRHNDGINEIDIETIVVEKENVEIVSINVEDVDTYLVNGYVTHNKGGNTHTDESAPSAPTSLAWDNAINTLSWSGDGTNDVYDLQVSTVSNFADPLAFEVDETEWSATSYVYGTPPGNGTYYARVRQYGTNGLRSAYSSTLTFTKS